MEKLHNEKQTT